jgi:hypothetical protein
MRDRQQTLAAEGFENYRKATRREQFLKEPVCGLWPGQLVHSPGRAIETALVTYRLIDDRYGKDLVILQRPLLARCAVL